VLGWTSAWVAAWTARIELRAAALGTVRRSGWAFEPERNLREVVARAPDGRRVRWTERGVDTCAPGSTTWVAYVDEEVTRE
jgi:hypothetical protein